MALITLNKACLAYGHWPLLDHVDLALEARERVGLVGRNGTGKSSLLKVLAGQERLDDGEVQRQGGLRWAHVAQEPVLDAAHTVFEAAAAGLAGLRALHDRYVAQAEGEDLAALQNAIEAQDGWNWEQRVEQTLARLGLDALAREGVRVGSLSGGTRKRLALAQALVSRPDVLLLDEPTNHLDLHAIAWLEELLLDFAGSVVTISHDRAFLDRVATRIMELDRGRLSSYAGGFTAYQQLKEAQLAQEAVVQAKADRLLAQEEVWIRQGVEARRTRAQARIERLQRLREQRSQRREAIGRARLEVDRGTASGKLVAELDHVSKCFVRADGSEQVVVQRFSATFLRGDKVGLIGPNGAGKTTLLKLILGELEPDEGQARRGTQQTVAYFDQMRDALDLDATLEDFISPGSEWIEINGRRTHVKGYLGDFLFSPARAASPVRTLSGGERNRLLLARLFARPANVLVLDEPTNDLDIDTLELLESLLADYPGTVFLVSHDRRFLDQVVTSTIAYEGQGRWREFEGGVEDWLLQARRSGLAIWSETAATPGASAAASLAASPATSAATTPGAVAPSAASGARRKLSYKEQRELDALPAAIEALEAEQREIASLLADGSLYASDHGRAQALAARSMAIEDELMAALERWEALGARA